MIPKILMVLLTVGMAVPGHADSVRAGNDYSAGLSLERAHEYRQAAREFRRALREDRHFVLAHKQWGTCLYYLGHPREALRQYDIYLAARPDDMPTRNFARSLRERLANGGVVSSPRRRLWDAGPQPFRGTFYAGMSEGLLFPGGGDLTSLFGPGSNTGLDFAAMEDPHAGYQWPNGMAVEAGMEFLGRAATETTGFGGSYAVSASEVGLYAEPLYRYALGPRSALMGGLKVGDAAAAFSTQYGSATGSGVFVAPEVRYQILFGGRFGLEFGAEYRVAGYAPMNGPGGTVPNSDGSGNWHLQDSGLALRLGLNVYFRRMLIP